MNPEHPAERVMAFIALHPSGLSSREVATGTGMTRSTVMKYLYILTCAERLTHKAGNRMIPGNYTVRELPPPPAPPTPLSVQARAALRVIRQLRSPSARALAAQAGYSYPTATRLWNELHEQGAV